MNAHLQSLSESEIRRRVKALCTMAPSERPISIAKLAFAAGLESNTLYNIANDKYGSIAGTVQRRLALALTRVENDQFVITRRHHQKDVIAVRPPQPPQEVTQRVEMTKNGPRLQFVVKNPRAFPDFKPK